MTRSLGEANDPSVLLRLPQASLNFNCKHCGHSATLPLLEKVVTKISDSEKGMVNLQAHFILCKSCAFFKVHLMYLLEFCVIV